MAEPSCAAGNARGTSDGRESSGLAFGSDKRNQLALNYFVLGKGGRG
jgi:hypothetical protein